MSRLDGNALAGALADIFAVDMTSAMARCAGCGDMSAVAQAVVYVDAAGTVVRCRCCDAVLATLVQADDRAWLSLTGISAIEVARR